MDDLLFLIPAIPLVGAVVLMLVGKRIGDPSSGWVATTSVGLSFAVTVGVFADLMSRDQHDRAITQTLWDWIPAGNFNASIGFLADPLSITMALFVTGVGAMIFLFAIGYMKGDEHFPKFFTYLSLFVFSMLVLVMADNLLLTFLGWEGVGACSYLLISFWFTDEANASAGKKAFVTNRVGDFGYMVAMFLTWTVVGSINYVDINSAAGSIASVTATAIVLLFFLGATGKSAQLPLFVWLPDAMAGPTPVSALIHAATMVTSGVYLLIRLNPLVDVAGWANDVIAWVGAITALVTATIAVSQNDIKKVLAYSTISQLGYLFLAVGTGAYVAAMFHMVTHAFFKALLFLGAGSVIHEMAHDQDMRHYGNLRKYMPITAGTFIVGWLAIAGVPPLAGFWSKDEILAGAWDFGPWGKVLWAMGLITALLTAFYMSRQVFMTFFGKEKWRDLPADELGVDHEDEHDGHRLTPDFTPHESPWIMTLPLVVLAFFAVVSGLINTPFSESFERLSLWLEPVLAHPHETLPLSVLAPLAGIAVVAALLGIVWAWWVYIKHKMRPETFELEVFAKGWYIDESYAAFFGGPGRKAFEALCWFDEHIVDGAVNGVGGGLVAAGDQLRKLQSGRVRGYALSVAVGAVAMVGYILVRIGS